MLDLPRAHHPVVRGERDWHTPRLDIRFTAEAGRVRIVEEFDTETTNSIEHQRKGWQAILDSFKRYVEGG